MAKAILNCSPFSGYVNRLPDEFHFRQMHRGEINQCYRDHVIFYEPGHLGGRQGYFAVARIAWLRAASERGMGHFYATLNDYREFPRRVPIMAGDGQYYEREAVSQHGRIYVQPSVRFPSVKTFDRILIAGGLPPMTGRALAA